MNVYQKLNKARADFHQQKLIKTGHNKFAGYNYFELGDFLIPALSIFNENGLCGIVSFGATEAAMRVVDCDKPEDMIVFTSPLSEANLKGCHPVQNVGAVETYQRRYLWQVALEIVEHSAVDGAQVAGKKPGKIAVKEGIGDDLPEDWKSYLKGLAFEVKEDVDAGRLDDAKKRIKDAALEDDQYIYMDRQLDSKTRSALKPKAPV
jgi:hypothetical protein